MKEENENPYAAPAIESSTSASKATEPRSPMPGSVIGAICCLCLLLACGFWGLYECASRDIGSPLNWFALPLSIGVFVLAGLMFRNRFAWICGRLLSIFMAFLNGAFVLYLLAESFRIGAAPVHTPEAGTGLMQGFYAAALFGLAICFAVYIALLLGIFFALGTTSARRWFRRT